MATKRYDVILFDLDGTLADSLPLMRQIYFDFVARHGGRGRDAEFNELNGKSLAEIISLLKSRYAMQADDKALLDEYRAEIARRYLTEVQMTPNAAQTLARLSSLGYQLGLVTSASEELARGFLARHELAMFFTHLVCATSRTKGKPDPELYLTALKCFGVEAKRALVVEDAENGLIAARAAGIAAVQVTSEEGLSRLLQKLPASGCQVIPLSRGLQVKLDESLAQKLDPTLEQQIEEVWRSEVKRRGGNLMNGKLLAYVRQDGNTIVGRFVEYKHYMAQRVRPELKARLRATPLAVSGLIRTEDAVLVARRSSKVTSYAGFYELVPSGSLEQVDFVGQLLAELKEEVGIDSSEVLECTPLALIFDEGDLVYDIAVDVKLKTSVKQLVSRLKETPEYERPLVLPREQLAKFIAEHRSLIVPTSLAILESQGFLLE